MKLEKLLMKVYFGFVYWPHVYADHFQHYNSTAKPPSSPLPEVNTADLAAYIDEKT